MARPALSRVSHVVARYPRAAPLAGYVLLSFLFFGLPVVSHPGRSFIGYGNDPEIFIWAFAWWPHAIGDGIDPLYTRVLWVPDGLSLAWTTVVPGLALAFAPLTLLASATVAYNVASVLMPALAAWTGYLLCRDVTGALWPSLAGGYLFGFSSYMLGQQAGHMHMTSVFLVPLVALVVLRCLDGRLSRRALVLWLGLILAVQFSFSSELYFTLSLALAVALAVSFALVPERRAGLRRLFAPLLGGYALSAVLASPLLYPMLEQLEHESINRPRDFPADLVNLVVPTRTTLVGGDWASSVSDRFIGGIPENGTYLGLPVLVIVGLYAWSRARTSGGRFLLTSFGLAVFAALGTSLHVAGERIVSLPWGTLARAPFFENVLPVRLMLFASLAAAVMVATWAAAARQRLAAGVLTALAVVALLPNLGAGYWKRTPVRPAFFAHGLYKACVARGENLLAVPWNSNGDSLLWQVESGFWFGLAEGYVRPGIPLRYRYDLIAPLYLNQVPEVGTDPEPFYAWAQSKAVNTIVVQEQADPGWAGFFTSPTRPALRVGEVSLFSVQPGAMSSEACARASAAP